MGAVGRTGGMVLAVLGAAAGAVYQAAPAVAATPTLSSQVAYVRSGNVYVSKGATEKRLTTGGGYSRPSWSRDGRQLAVLKGGQVWVMKADGTAKRRLSTRPAAGASWSPDGRWIAFASASCTGGPGVYRISTTARAATPQVLFPSECRGEALPDATAPAAPATGTLAERLRYDNAVAWSPDGGRIVFRGGLCESIYDDCLTIGTVSTGAERTVAAYGGGSLQNSGFAVLPGWRPDGTKLAWTAYQQGETTADNQPVHVVEFDPATGVKRTLGAPEDRELAYVDANRAVVTGQYRGGSWVLTLDLRTGARAAFHAGSQPSVQPVAR
ncbi:WD40 repeat protein [Krasilnikovia cinnamomea]|uniref:WD40 repeat protein n=1 Tax=Krasilnikovia cinnamomea TaxID=349313 RepID=A0A4Q7ZEF6_9ACTN|nr:hypothetical protein [Krasilnikovia cinnamomea]RZU49100.1 WD40 repeat protein [Krasilnikovia cinnamomea]